MDAQTKRVILQRRIEMLRGHIEHVGESSGFKRELEKAEAALREIGGNEQPRG